MGIRKTAIKMIGDALQNLHIGNGMVLKSFLHLSDPLVMNPENFPYVAITPGVHNIQVLLSGSMGDDTCIINMYGYTYSREDEEILLTVEDIIKAITDKLMSRTQAALNNSNGFAIEGLGPIVSEEYPAQMSIGMFSLPISITFLEDQLV